MNISARVPFWEGFFNTKLYVKPGLIALFDGIENAGYEIHSSDVSTWKNLVGPTDAVITWGSAPTATKNSVYFDGKIHTYKIATLFNKPQQITIEVVTDAVQYTGSYVGYFTSVESGGVGFQNTSWCVANPTGGYYTRPSIYKPTKPTVFTGTASDRARVYVNGVLYGTSSQSTAAGIRYNYNYFTIGGDAGSENNSALKGNIFCIRAYNRALTAEEIAHNFQIDRMRFKLTPPLLKRKISAHYLTTLSFGSSWLQDIKEAA